MHDQLTSISPHITSISAAGDFMRCPEYYRLKRGNRLFSKRQSPALWIGKHAHRVLEAFYTQLVTNGRNTEDAAQHMKAAAVSIEAEVMDEIQNQPDADKLEQVAAILHGIAAAYPAWAAKADQLFEAIEPGSIERKGKFLGYEIVPDLLVWMKPLQSDGDKEPSLMVMDHKTHDKGKNAGFYEVSSFDYQLGVYSAAYGAKGVIYNLIAKPAIRQRKNESRQDFISRIIEEYTTKPMDYFTRVISRVDPVKSYQQAVSFIKGMEAQRSAAEQMALALRSEGGDGSYPRNSKACVVFGNCPYLPVCQGNPLAFELYENAPVPEDKTPGTDVMAESMKKGVMNE